AHRCGGGLDRLTGDGSAAVRVPWHPPARGGGGYVPGQNLFGTRLRPRADGGRVGGSADRLVTAGTPGVVCADGRRGDGRMVVSKPSGRRRRILMSATMRVARPEDAEAIVTIYTPIVRDTAISFEVEPPTHVEMHERIATTLRRLPWLVCEHQGEVLGYVYASPHRARAAYQWSVDVSVYIHAKA